MNYDTVCFVIMPFGRKAVVDEKGAQRTVDFDAVYDGIFEPAIRATALPEGGTLEPRRTDKDFFAGHISQDMFEYLEYSRFALADISGLNANVLYELGVRHRARQAGTAIFRQVGALIPFDINQIKAFAYEYEPDTKAAESRTLITHVLTESLAQNRIDSPVRLALAVQRAEHRDIEIHLKDAENAIREGNRGVAIAAYRRALDADPGNNLLHLRIGLLLKDEGRWEEALAQFDRAIAASPAYPEAWREKGIAENKLFHKRGRPAGEPDGVAALKKAVSLNPEDFDALASLGGALKRAGREAESLDAYRRATEVSRGHSYPLLNWITLAAKRAGTLELDKKQQFFLSRSERSLRANVATNPPFGPPWSFFDLAQTRLFLGDSAEFLEIAERGTEFATHRWQVETFADTLRLLDGVPLPGLAAGVAMLEERAAFLE